jgi:chemotaxis protein methyltransferase CheR
VRFAWNNLAADPVTPPLADIDLIVCRNVTIYFDAATTQRLYRALIDALAPGGWLVLGPSDPLPSHPHRLERIEAADTVLWRRPGAERSTPEARRPGAGGSTPESRRPPTSSARRLPASRSVPSMCAPAPVQASAPRVAPPAADRSPAPLAAAVADDDALRAGLLALESGSYASAVHWLRQATFRDPNTPLGQLALARAYLGSGDTSRAQAALVYADRLLADLGEDNLAPGSETLSVATLRQTVQTHLARLPRP